MSKLKEIEKEILDLKSKAIDPENSEDFYLTNASYLHPEDYTKSIEKQVEKLETKRRFLLDKRESWLPKTIWNLAIPIIISIITTILTLYIQKS